MAHGKSVRALRAEVLAIRGYGEDDLANIADADRIQLVDFIDACLDRTTEEIAALFGVDIATIYEDLHIARQTRGERMASRFDPLVVFADLATEADKAVRRLMRAKKELDPLAIWKIKLQLVEKAMDLGLLDRSANVLEHRFANMDQGELERQIGASMKRLERWGNPQPQ